MNRKIIIALSFTMALVFSSGLLFSQEKIVLNKNIKVEKIEKKDEKDENIKPDNNKANTENNSNGKNIQYGSSLFQTVKQGGKLMIFILLIGLAGLTIVIERAIFFIKNRSWKKGELENHFNDLIENSKAKYKEQLEDELRESFQIYANKIERGMALLNGLGNIAPIMGFLGTVIGMINAFAAIAAATSVNAKVVAVGIQEALVTTAGGLSVAAPLLISFHFLNHFLQNIYSYSDELVAEKTSSMPSILDSGVNQ